jgi:6-phosphogluconolactonase
MNTSEDPTHDQNPRSSTLTRRQFLPLLGATAALATVAPGAVALAKPGGKGKKPLAEARFVYVGTYTAPGTPPGGTKPSTAVGIYVFELDPEDGGLTPVEVVETSNPSFLALDPTLTHLYCTNENDAPDGAVSAFAIDQATGTLSPLNTQSTNGAFPAHLSVHPSGRYLLASNYGTAANPGNYPIYPIQLDGSIGLPTDDFHVDGNGAGPNPGRQEAAHAHQILTDLDANHVFGVDLGADRVIAWNLDLVTGTLAFNTVPFGPVASGSGPRHMAFHPSRQFAYVLNELVSSIDTFAYDPVRGAFIWRQTLSTLPAKFTGSNTTAEIRIHPTGRFLYATNRGHNSVAMFEIDPDTGKLGVIGWESTRGEWPRGMNIDPSGTFLYACNQNSDTIVVFRIHLPNGRLKPTGAVVQTPTPVDVEFGSLA